MSGAPIDVIEAALGERIAIGAPTLARRMARDRRRLRARPRRRAGSSRARSARRTPIDFDPAWLAASRPTRAATTRSTRCSASSASCARARRGLRYRRRARARRSRWSIAGSRSCSPRRPRTIRRARTGRRVRRRAGARALPRGDHGAPTHARRRAAHRRRRGARARPPPSRTRSRDREARAVLGALEPLLRRVDRWIGATWLGTVERALRHRRAQRAATSPGFARDLPTVAARILGPEETAVLSWSVARLHRERPDGWAARSRAQAARLAMPHRVRRRRRVGRRDRRAARRARDRARRRDRRAPHRVLPRARARARCRACTLARVLFGAGRAPAALAVLSAGSRAATRDAWRDAHARRARASAGETSRPRRAARLRQDSRAAMFEALQKGDAGARREARPLGGRVRSDERRGASQPRPRARAAGQGRRRDASPRARHARAGDADPVRRALPERQAPRGDGGARLREPLVRARRSVADVRRHRVRGDGQPAHGAARTGSRTSSIREAFDASQLNAYAGVLDEVGDYATCETIANAAARAPRATT